MPNLRMLIKCVIAYMVYHSGLFKTKLNHLSKDRFLVLMYHRIIPSSDVGPYVQPGMYVTPETFDLHLGFLKEHFEIRPVSDLCSHAASVHRNHPEKHACYLTFDDGWRDFYHYAYPLLLKHQVPATVYLPTGLIGTGKSFWTERFGRICEQAERKGILAEVKKIARTILMSDGISISSLSLNFFEDVIRELKIVTEDRIETFLSSLEDSFHISLPVTSNDFLTWVQIKEMYSSDLVSFGSHTVNHHILGNLTDEDICSELYLSKQCLIDNKIVNRNNVSFCYPNGYFNTNISQHVIDANYSFSFTTQCSWNRFNYSMLNLKRIGLHQDISFNNCLLAYRIYTAPCK